MRDARATVPALLSLGNPRVTTNWRPMWGGQRELDGLPLQREDDFRDALPPEEWGRPQSFSEDVLRDALPPEGRGRPQAFSKERLRGPVPRGIDPRYSFPEEGMHRALPPGSDPPHSSLNPGEAERALSQLKSRRGSRPSSRPERRRDKQRSRSPSSSSSEDEFEDSLESLEDDHGGPNPSRTGYRDEGLLPPSMLNPTRVDHEREGQQLENPNLLPSTGASKHQEESVTDAMLQEVLVRLERAERENHDLRRRIQALSLSTPAPESCTAGQGTPMETTLSHGKIFFPASTESEGSVRTQSHSAREAATSGYAPFSKAEQAVESGRITRRKSTRQVDPRRESPNPYHGSDRQDIREANSPVPRQQTPRNRRSEYELVGASSPRQFPREQLSRRRRDARSKRSYEGQVSSALVSSPVTGHGVPLKTLSGMGHGNPYATYGSSQAAGYSSLIQERGGLPSTRVVSTSVSAVTTVAGFARQRGTAPVQSAYAFGSVMTPLEQEFAYSGASVQDRHYNPDAAYSAAVPQLPPRMYTVGYQPYAAGPPVPLPNPAVERYGESRMAMQPSKVGVTVASQTSDCPIVQTASPTPVGKPKKLRSFTAKTETWEVYKTHLDLVARLNRWDEARVLENFCTELAGEALEFYCSLSPSDRDDYSTVMTSMAQRFGTMVNAEAVRSKLENRRQKPSETLEQLATDIRMLAYKVYSTDTFERREAETVRCFMKAVRDEHIVQALIQAHPVLSMSEALVIAVKARELTGAFLPKRTAVRTVQDESATASTQSGKGNSNAVAEFLKQGDPELYAVYVAQEASKAFDRKGTGKGKGGGGNVHNRLCWYCQSQDHWAKDCYLHPKNWPSEFKEMLRSGKLYQQPMSAQAAGMASSSQTQSGNGSQTCSNQNAGGQGAKGTGKGRKKGWRQKKNGGNANGGNNAKQGGGAQQQPQDGTNAGGTLMMSPAAVTSPSPSQGTGNA